MDTIWTDEKIPFDTLVLHPANVRAKSPDTYAPENIADITATLPAMGLIHPLAVQKLDVNRHPTLTPYRRPILTPFVLSWPGAA